MLGNLVEQALSLVGITESRVESWLGQPCGCKERKEKLNDLGRWAARVVAGKVEGSLGYLKELLDEE